MSPRLPWVLLVASLCLNAALLLRGAARNGGSAAPAGGPAPMVPPAAGSASPPSADRADAARAAPAAGTQASADAARAAALEAQVVRLERELFAKLRPDERFVRSAGGSDAEARIRADLERVLKAAGVASWSLACRGDTCRLEILSGGRDQLWDLSLKQDDALRRWVRGWQFQAGTPKTDPVSGETYDESDVYFDVRKEPDRLGPELRRLVAAFKASAALLNCTGGFAQKGVYQARVQLGPEGLYVTSAGSLAARPAGRCLEEGLRAALAALAGERPLDTAVVFVRMTSPP